MRNSSVLRIAGAIAALVFCAWFALGIRQAQSVDAATSILGAGHGPISRSAANHARQLLDSAAQLNPDQTVELLRSQLALREGDPARARAIALSVTRAEPDNLQAWIAYGTASSNDPAAFHLALRHLEQLAPNVGSKG